MGRQSPDIRAAAWAALTGLAAFSPHAAALPLTAAQLNGGPSSERIPAAPGDPVAAFRYPRVIVDQDVFLDGVSQAAIGDVLTDSTLVQVEGDPSRGLRHRSIAVIEGVNINANASIELVANLPFDVDPTESYFVVLDWDDAQHIHTLADLEAFCGVGSSLAGSGEPGEDFIKILLDGNTLGAGDLDLAASATTAASMGMGVRVGLPMLISIDPGAPGSAHGAPAQWRNFEVGVFVLEDIAPGNQGTDVVTEWICVGYGDRVYPLGAQLDPDNQTIRIRATHQLEDDDAAQNPADTNATTLSATTDFRVRTADIAFLNLAAFLAGLDAPRSITSIAVVGNKKDVLELRLDAPLVGADLEQVLQASIGFFTSSKTYGVAGANPNGSTLTFQWIRRLLGPCPEDADGDDDVDLADISILLGEFNTDGFGLDADVDGDRDVDFADLNRMLAELGGDCFEGN